MGREMDGGWEGDGSHREGDKGKGEKEEVGGGGRKKEWEGRSKEVKKEVGKERKAVF